MTLLSKNGPPKNLIFEIQTRKIEIEAQKKKTPRFLVNLFKKRNFELKGGGGAFLLCGVGPFFLWHLILDLTTYSWRVIGFCTSNLRAKRGEGGKVGGEVEVTLTYWLRSFNLRLNTVWVGEYELKWWVRGGWARKFNFYNIMIIIIVLVNIITHSL